MYLSTFFNLAVRLHRLNYLSNCRPSFQGGLSWRNILTHVLKLHMGYTVSLVEFLNVHFG